MGRTLVTGCAISSAFASTSYTSVTRLSAGKRTQGSSAAITSPCSRCPDCASTHFRTSASTASSPTCHRCSVGSGGLQRWQAPLPQLRPAQAPCQAGKRKAGWQFGRACAAASIWRELQLGA